MKRSCGRDSADVVRFSVQVALFAFTAALLFVTAAQPSPSAAEPMDGDTRWLFGLCKVYDERSQDWQILTREQAKIECAATPFPGISSAYRDRDEAYDRFEKQSTQNCPRISAQELRQLFTPSDDVTESATFGDAALESAAFGEATFVFEGVSSRCDQYDKNISYIEIVEPAMVLKNQTQRSRIAYDYASANRICHVLAESIANGHAYSVDFNQAETTDGKVAIGARRTIFETTKWPGRWIEDPVLPELSQSYFEQLSCSITWLP